MDKVLKILLDSARSEQAQEKENRISLDLNQTGKLLPNYHLSNELSLYQLYNDERDYCNKYRLIFTIDPVCSNVLFNRYTEILFKEGSNDCTSLCGDSIFDESEIGKHTINTLKEITHGNAMDNTEYTHPSLSNLVYHCGMDIFDNHLLRGNSFEKINKISSSEAYSHGEIYNTVNDYLRNNLGSVVMEDVGISGIDKKQMHVYTVDNFLTMKTAFDDKCIEKNGWFGFTNKASLEMPNGKVGDKYTQDLIVNKVMNNNKACEFIDMYPDRTLFSFIPKFNKYRHRAENNWDCCITYPWENDYDKFNEVSQNCGSGHVKIIDAELSHTNGGSDVIRLKSQFKHTIKAGEYIRLYYIREEDLNDIISGTVPGKKFEDYVIRHPEKSQVFMVGDFEGNYNEYYMSLLMRNFENKIDYYEDTNYFVLSGEHNDKDNRLHFFYRKEVDGTECQYYFRKFKKFKRYDGDDLRYVLNKLAYGENIYGDRFAQAVFSDDVNIEGLTDNLGRELTELYFTVVKRNQGYDSWYNLNNFSGETIEYSHCFGEVISGLEVLTINKPGGQSEIEDECKNYNIKCINSIEPKPFSEDTTIFSKTRWDATIQMYKPIFIESGEDIIKSEVLESGITIDYDWFYGDVIEFCPTLYEENVISYVYHRFNTAQRETYNKAYADICVHDLEYDDYDDIIERPEGKESGFYVSYSCMTGNYYGNVCPEGYYYNPHNKVKIKDIVTDRIESSIPRKLDFVQSAATCLSSTTVEVLPGVYIKDEFGNNALFSECTISLAINYGMSKYDTVLIYDTITHMTIHAYVFNTVISDGKYIVTLLADDESLDPDKMLNEKYIFVYGSQDVPSYAAFSPEAGTIYWRNIKLLSECDKDSELVDTPFTNGRLYIHRNVNFFLMRQDPRNEYGLCQPVSSDYFRKFNKKGNSRVDLSKVLNLLNNLKDTCS